jgi:dTDP-4-dehydrorhamnose 3,5-epimerase-like enzyme
MKVINIYETGNEGLGNHSDIRGSIFDIFYNTQLNHVAIINSNPSIIRGNHYHKETTQHILITEGELEYWFKSLDDKELPQMYLAKKGDLISTPPYEIHTLKITEKGNTFIVFSEGKRGGADYESDTFRVSPII